MECPGCGRGNRDDARFCDACGAALAARCTGCGRELRSDARFCDGCGTAVAGAPQRDPRDYTPPHLVQRILQSRSALEGERKQVTVLFADVKGSMELADRVDPEEWHRILDGFFQILAEGVHRFEGTVNQYTGDGVMALFGAPIAHEDHAQRACYAALHLGDELRRYAVELRRERGFDFAVRMGLNSGDVVVGKIGDDLRMDYTAQGHTVGLAARMQALAEAGKAYLTGETASRVEGYFALEDLGEFRVKGVREPVPVYALEGVGPLRTRFDLSRARGLSRFVGRAAEGAVLEAAFQRAADGNGGVVGVVGDAGVGKSRLCFELAERCRGRGIPVREGHGVPHGRAVPLLPVFELLRGFFAIGARDGGREVRQKIAGTLLLLDRDLEDALPLLFEFLGAPDPQRPAPVMDPEARQRRLFGVLGLVVQARSREEPAVVLIEDLHWLDAASDAFLANLVESLPGTRVLLLANFRPEYHAPWMQKSYYQQLPLFPLGAEAVHELARDLLGHDASLVDLPERICQRAGGNPFFVEELVRSLADSRALEGSRGAWRLAREVGSLRLPDSVEAVLAARIDRLPEREKRLLQGAAVIGKEVPERLLREVSDLPDRELRESLQQLTAAELLEERGLYPDVEYGFRHPLTQEVAYGSQLGETRARLHAAVARAIAELDADKLDERAALLAHHWERADEPLEAARCHARAASWAGLLHPEESIRHSRRVRELLATAEESPETIALGLAARIQIAFQAERVGAPEEEVSGLLAEGRELAERGADRRSLVVLLTAGSRYEMLRGRPRAGIEAAQEAARLADAIGDPGLLGIAAVPLCLGNLQIGRLAEAEEVIEEALARIGEGTAVGAGHLPIDLRGQLVMGRVSVLGITGRVAEARSQLDQGVARMRALGDLPMVCALLTYHSMLAEISGETAGCVERCAEAVEIAERVGSPLAGSMSYRALGEAHLLCESWDQARAALEQALAIGRERDVAQFAEPLTLALLARALTGQGEAERAVATAREALALAERAGTVEFEASARRTLAWALLRRDGAGARSEAEAQLERAEDIYEETGARGFLPLLHLERAELARACGDEAARERELREAHRLAIELGATGHARRLAAELGRA